jgi:hypothetical protein
MSVYPRNYFLIPLLILFFTLSSAPHLFAERDVVVKSAAQIRKERELQHSLTKEVKALPVSQPKAIKISEPTPKTTIVYQEKTPRKSFFEALLDKMTNKKK